MKKNRQYGRAFKLFIIFISVTVISIGLGAYHAYSDAPTDGLVSFWQLDEGTGTNTTDSIGGGSGALVNGPTWTDAKVGKGLNFDGANDRVDTTLPGTANSLTDMTISAWTNARTFGGGSSGTILSKSGGRY